MKRVEAFRRHCPTLAQRTMLRESSSFPPIHARTSGSHGRISSSFMFPPVVSYSWGGGRGSHNHTLQLASLVRDSAVREPSAIYLTHKEGRKGAGYAIIIIESII